MCFTDSISHSVVSDSVTPWTVACQAPLSMKFSTGVGSHSLLQGIFPTQGLNPGLLYCRQILYYLSTKEAHLSDTYIIKHGIWAFLPSGPPTRSSPAWKTLPFLHQFILRFSPSMSLPQGDHLWQKLLTVYPTSLLPSF